MATLPRRPVRAGLSQRSSSQMRVIFDRSAFHGNNFDILERSPLRKLVATNRLRVFLTPVFFEETLAAFGSKRASSAWREHLNFALDVCNGGIFLDQSEIWHNELVAGKGKNARYLRRLRPGFIDALRRGTTSDDIMANIILRDAKSAYTEDQQKKDNWKATCRWAREAMSLAIKEGKVTPEPVEGYRCPFSDILRLGFVEIGRKLMPLVDRDRNGQLADVWAQAPNRFPYYSAFVEGVIYSIYYAANERNLPLDRNAIMDLDHLAYLTWTDLVVSNDTRFFRSAFETLWKARGKRMESTGSFVELLKATA
jgi:hypothetical protein